MKRMGHWLYRLGVLLLLGGLVYLKHSCVPIAKKGPEKVVVDWSDPIIRKLYEFELQRNSDSLQRYLTHPVASYRFFAARALISVGDSSMARYLVPLLKDKVEQVRQAAIEALGQIGDSTFSAQLVAAFRRDDSLRQYSATNALILEIIGRIGSKDYLRHLATVESYRPEDTALLIGLAKGIYRYSQRNAVHPVGTRKMVEFLKTNLYPEELSLYASIYLSRRGADELKPYVAGLIRAIKVLPAPEARAYLAIALGKTLSTSARSVLLNIASDTAEDYRVRIAAVRALGNFSASINLPRFSALRYDSDRRVAQAVAEYFIDFGNADDALDYKEWAKEASLDPVVRARLMGAALRHLPAYYVLTRSGLRYRLYQWYRKETRPFIRREIVRAMAYAPQLYTALAEIALKDDHPAVRTQSMQSLRTLFESDLLDATYGAAAYRIRRHIWRKLQQIFRSEDPGLLAEGIPILQSKKFDFAANKEQLLFLDSLQKRLPLPAAIETYNIMEEVLSQLFERRPHYIKPHPKTDIDWSAFDALADTIAVEVRTQRGVFGLQLFKKQAPFTVLHFVSLMKDKFFEGKVFHRVVDGFVVQDGCPRGDGYGALDYTIPSDLKNALYDDSGILGMASAGKDTECTQWFVTQSPAPFLDWRYTAFGKVDTNPEVVYHIRPGDTIYTMQIIQ